jgi:hypothetical protein
MFLNTTSKIPSWVVIRKSRYEYRLHLEGRKKSHMTTPQIQELERLGFEWKLYRRPEVVIPKEPSVDDNAMCVRERVVEASRHVQTTAQTRKTSAVENRSNQVDVDSVPEYDWNGGSARLHPVSNRRNLAALGQDIMYDLTRRIMMFVESSFSARLVARGRPLFFMVGRGTSSTCRSASVWCRWHVSGNTKLSIRDDRWRSDPVSYCGS